MNRSAALQLHSIQLAWGRVRHKRYLPTINAFDTQACFVRVRFCNTTESSSYQPTLLKIDSPGIVSLHGKDYGTSPHTRSLAEQATYMRQLVQNQTQHDLSGQVELHTFPRMLGYAFNPVSFWYFYTPQQQCLSILCEVNNTFGERHFYWLDSQSGAPINQGSTLSAHKQFHVSPFFPVSGQYQFRFMDAANRTVARIDYFDNQQRQLTTSVSGTLMQPTPRIWVKTLLKFGWFSCTVITKIHWQAVKLYLKRIQFYKKPTPPKHTITKVTHHEQ